MNNIVIAVDDTKSTTGIFSKCTSICKSMNPDNVTLVYVEKYTGRSIMDDMLGDNDLKQLQEVIEGTEFKEALDAKAKKILNHYKEELINKENPPKVNTVIRFGHPADQIMQVAEEINADMIVMGSRGKRDSSIFMGSVSREVSNSANRPVLLVR